MSSQVDWRQELDEAITHGPDRPARDYVVAGHRALRRRRLAAGAVAVAAACALGWVASPYDGPARGVEPAASTTTDPTATPTSPAEPVLAPVARRPEDVRPAHPGEIEDFEGDPDLNVVALGSGELVHRPGWRVASLRVLDDETERRRWALDLAPESGGRHQWVRLSWRPEGSGQVSQPAARGSRTFGAWVSAQRQGDDR